MRKIVNIIVTIIIILLLGFGLKEILGFVGEDIEDNSLRNEVVEIPKTSESDHEKQKDVDSVDPMDRKIDFAYLKNINPDIVGWIYIPGTKVDYPLLCGKNNTYYLKHDFKKKYSSLGAVFAFSGSNFEQDHKIDIFAHNTISGQSFGKLRKYKTKEYALNHQYLYIYTPAKTQKCKLFSAFRCDKSDDIFDTKMNEKGITEIIEELSNRSTNSYEIPDKPGQIFSLGTCDGYRGTNRRFTVHFTSIEEKYIIE